MTLAERVNQFLDARMPVASVPPNYALQERVYRNRIDRAALSPRCASCGERTGHTTVCPSREVASW